jgi:hypothetical protein
MNRVWRIPNKIKSLRTELKFFFQFWKYLFHLFYDVKVFGQTICLLKEVEVGYALTMVWGHPWCRYVCIAFILIFRSKQLTTFWRWQKLWRHWGQWTVLLLLNLLNLLYFMYVVYVYVVCMHTYICTVIYDRKIFLRKGKILFQSFFQNSISICRKDVLINAVSHLQLNFPDEYLNAMEINYPTNVHM